MTTLLLDEMTVGGAMSRQEARMKLRGILERPLDEAAAEQYDRDLFSFSEEALAAEAANEEALDGLTYGLEP